MKKISITVFVLLLFTIGYPKDHALKDDPWENFIGSWGSVHLIEMGDSRESSESSFRYTYLNLKKIDEKFYRLLEINSHMQLFGRQLALSDEENASLKFKINRTNILLSPDYFYYDYSLGEYVGIDIAMIYFVALTDGNGSLNIVKLDRQEEFLVADKDKNIRISQDQYKLLENGQSFLLRHSFLKNIWYRMFERINTELDENIFKENTRLRYFRGTAFTHGVERLYEVESVPAEDSDDKIAKDILNETDSILRYFIFPKGKWNYKKYDSDGKTTDQGWAYGFNDNNDARVRLFLYSDSNLERPNSGETRLESKLLSFSGWIKKMSANMIIVSEVVTTVSKKDGKFSIKNIGGFTSTGFLDNSKPNILNLDYYKDKKSRWEMLYDEGVINEYREEDGNEYLYFQMTKN